MSEGNNDELVLNNLSERKQYLKKVILNKKEVPYPESL
jgi:hypothetical protein